MIESLGKVAEGTPEKWTLLNVTTLESCGFTGGRHGDVPVQLSGVCQLLPHPPVWIPGKVRLEGKIRKTQSVLSSQVSSQGRTKSILA